MLEARMARITINDDVIWKKHIHGDATLAEAVERLRGGETLQLRVEGSLGLWRKMDDGRDGRPTLGIRPVGPARTVWRDLYQTRRGEEVTVDLVEGMGEADAPAFRHEGAAPGTIRRTEAERRAAIEAILASAGKGWVSDGRKMTRDEMHER
jgi:hypothetical protein